MCLYPENNSMDYWTLNFYLKVSWFWDQTYKNRRKVLILVAFKEGSNPGYTDGPENQEWSQNTEPHVSPEFNSVWPKKMWRHKKCSPLYLSIIFWEN